MTSVNRKLAKRLVLPASAVWMEHLALEMTVCASKKIKLFKRRSTIYELQMTKVRTKNRQPESWTISHTFDEYRALQQRLIKVLQRGHKCNAECKWLINVVKNYFPKASIFGNNYSGTVESRRLSLLRLMVTVKSSLINHGNTGCFILREHVSKEFASFLLDDCQETAAQQHKRSVITDSIATPGDATGDEYMSTVVPITSNEDSLAMDTRLTTS